MTFISTDDIEARAGRELTEAETTRVEALTPDAEAAVVLYTGQQFAAGETTATFKIRRGIVRLPQRPVTAIDSVEDTDGNAVTYQWDGHDRLEVGSQVPDTFSWVPYTTRLRSVAVSYSHGYEVIPAVVIGIVCNIVLRALGQAPEDAGLTQESIDSYSYSRGVIGAAGAFGLLPDEKAALDVYRRVGGTIEVAR